MSAGGVTTDAILSAVLLLLLTCLQVGAFAIMLSSFCRPTVSAFIATYLLGLVVYFGPMMAVMTCLVVVIVWVLLAPVVVVVMAEVLNFRQRSVAPLYLLSPASIIPLNEFNDLDEFGMTPWVAVVVNFLWYGSITLFLRSLCLWRADRCLGRA